MSKSYRVLRALHTLEERFNYLKLAGFAFEETFGSARHMNQVIYRSSVWRSVRDQVIVRDGGCDLGVFGHEIHDKIIVHHINPITPQQIEERSLAIFDPDNLICVSERTHQAIHFGDSSLLPKDPIVRRPGDTIPWKR